MRYFAIEFKYKTKAWFRKARIKTQTICVAADDITHAYRLAKIEGMIRFRGCWQVLKVQEIAAPK